MPLMASPAAFSIILLRYAGPDAEDNMYIRVKRPVEVRGEMVWCWVYICQMDIEKERGIAVIHGNWRKFLVESGEKDAADDWLVEQRAKLAAMV